MTPIEYRNHLLSLVWGVFNCTGFEGEIIVVFFSLPQVLLSSSR